MKNAPARTADKIYAASLGFFLGLAWFFNPSGDMCTALVRSRQNAFFRVATPMTCKSTFQFPFFSISETGESMYLGIYGQWFDLDVLTGAVFFAFCIVLVALFSASDGLIAALYRSLDATGEVITLSFGYGFIPSSLHTQLFEAVIQKDSVKLITLGFKFLCGPVASMFMWLMFVEFLFPELTGKVIEMVKSAIETIFAVICGLIMLGLGLWAIMLVFGVIFS